MGARCSAKTYHSGAVSPSFYNKTAVTQSIATSGTWAEPSAVCSCDAKYNAPHKFTCSDGTYNSCPRGQTCQSLSSFFKGDYASECSAEAHCTCLTNYGSVSEGA